MISWHAPVPLGAPMAKTSRPASQYRDPQSATEARMIHADSRIYLTGALRRQPLPLRIETIAYKESSLDHHALPHIHSEHQWLFCLHGGLRVSIDGTEHHLRPDQSILVSPGRV